MFGYPQPIYRYIYHIDGECESTKSTSPKSNPALPPYSYIHTHTKPTRSPLPQSINHSPTITKHPKPPPSRRRRLVRSHRRRRRRPACRGDGPLYHRPLRPVFHEPVHGPRAGGGGRGGEEVPEALEARGQLGVGAVAGEEGLGGEGEAEVVEAPAGAGDEDVVGGAGDVGLGGGEAGEGGGEGGEGGAEGGEGGYGCGGGVGG